ncbi:MAG: hypothetical protein R2939_17895 [Kofleriaceae bacterium]
MGKTLGILPGVTFACVAALLSACDEPTVTLGDTDLALSSSGSISCGQVRKNRATSNSTQATYACVPGSYGGREHVYTLDVNQTGDVVVSVSNFDVYPMLVVLKEVGGGINAATCVTGNYYAVRFPAVQGERYYVVTDTPAGSPVMHFDVAVECGADGVESSCGDGFDDDADWLVDCADPDCDGSSACDNGQCTPWETLACGDTLIAGRTDGFGSTDALDEYSCPSSIAPRGNERAYEFRPTESGRVVFTTSNANEYPMLFVLEDDGTGCNPNRCVAHNYYSVGFDAEVGKTYYLVADAEDARWYNFNVSLVCDPPATETTCTNDVDDDGDTLVDCRDPDCAGTPECVAAGRCEPTTQLTCATRLLHGDTAGAGATNAIGSYACAPNVPLGNPEQGYQIGPFSSDQDVLVTLSNESGYGMIAIVEDRGTGCDPASCVTQNYYSVEFRARKNKTYYAIVEGDLGTTISYDISMVCDPPGSEQGAACSDGIDNDGDALIDCADPHCTSECSQAGTCAAASALTCASTRVAGSTGATGNTDAVDAYGCYPAATLGGHEYTYTFKAPADGDYVFTLSNETDYATIAVLEDGVCDPFACEALQYYSTIATDLKKNRTYYVVVDSPGDTPVDFEISAVCNPSAHETACGDGVDNDGDFAIDCEDADCHCLASSAPSDRSRRADPSWIPGPRRPALPDEARAPIAPILTAP